MSTQKQSRTITLKSERGEKGLGVTLAFIKLTLIFILCALGLNVSAQQTALQNRIAAKNVGDTIRADSKNWCIINKTTLNGINYVYLLSVDIQLEGPADYGKTNIYQDSYLRTALNNYYGTYISQLKPFAVVPDLGNIASSGGQTTSTLSQPTAELAVGSGKTNILFAPSYNDIYSKFHVNGAVVHSIGNLPQYFHERFWTRSPGVTSEVIYEVFPSGKALVSNPLIATYIMYAGGIWVRTSALTVNYTVSGKVIGLPDVSNRTISYTINGGSTQTVNTDASGNYAITVPQGANLVITPPTITNYTVTPLNYTINNISSNLIDRDFTYYIPGFTVNDEDYLEMDGRSYCNVTNFTFRANAYTPIDNIVWRLTKGTELLHESQKNIAFSVTNLQMDYYTITLTVNGRTMSAHFAVGPISVIWMGTSFNNNWHNLNNWMPTIIPSSCNDVYIPGNLDYYPQLENAKPAQCRNIYFLYGSELGRPDLLTYSNAFVQYNFGLRDNNNPQQKDSNKDLVLKSSFTSDRLKFSAAYSATPINRERWYMLSAPLIGMVSGDLGFGGFPLTFLKKFGPINKDNANYPVGEWTTPYNSMKEPLANNITDGFAFYMYGLGNGISALGCEESGSFGQMNELSFMPFRSGGKIYGLRETNGILELPSYADSAKLYAHRTELYNGINMSTFFYIDDGSGNISNFNRVLDTQTPDLVLRSSSDYRFAPERNGSFAATLQHDIGAIPVGQEFLVGNPYMSSIDMVNFLNDNPNIDRSFRIWNGADFITCTVLGTGTVQTAPPHAGLNMRYISPLQGFLLKRPQGGVPMAPALRAGGNYVNFKVANISTVRPNGTAFNLRSSGENEEENLLRIKAENSSAASYAVIKYLEGASNDYVSGEDVQKLFSPLSYVPSIYFLLNEIPVDINLINDKKNIIIPIGIKTNNTGGITLTITGMDNYPKAKKIEFIDALENRTIDLTGMSSYTYAFNHNEKGIQNGRFSLKISSSLTNLPSVKIPGDLEVYGNSKGIYVISSEAVQKLDVFDFAGRKLYENNSDAKYYPLPDNLSKTPLIVKVVTKSVVKTVKVN